MCVFNGDFLEEGFGHSCKMDALDGVAAGGIGVCMFKDFPSVRYRPYTVHDDGVLPVLYVCINTSRLVTAVFGSSYARERSVILEVALGSPEAADLGRIGQLQATVCPTAAYDGRVVYVFLLNGMYMNQFSKLMMLMGVMACCLLACQPGMQASAESGPAVGRAPDNPPRRVGMVTGLKPEKAAYYKALHAEAWDGVLAAIKQYNIRNYSIYVKEIDGKLYLFSYYEYIGDDYEADMKRIAADTTTQRWWGETDPCQLPLPEAAENGVIWTPMEEVFHTD